MNLTSRVLLIVAATLLPALVIQGFNEIELRRERERQGADSALRQAELVNADIASIIAGARQAAAILSTLPGVQALDPGCGGDIAKALTQFERYGSISVFDRAGRAVCSTVEVPLSELRPPVAVERIPPDGSDVVVGAHDRGPRGDGHYLPLAYPIGRGGELRGALVLTLKLDWLGARVGWLKRSATSTVVVGDRDGTVIARYPDHATYVGRAFLPEVRPLLAADRPGNARVPGFDGRDRLIGYVPPAGNPAGLFTSVGLYQPELVADLDRATRRSLALAGAAVTVAVLLALLFGHFTIRRPTQNLLAAARRWQAGDLSARAAQLGGGSELGQLARGFNAMADALERRDRALRDSEERSRLAVEATGLGIWHMDFATGARDWSNELRRLFGLPEDIPPDPELMKGLLRQKDRSHLQLALDEAMRPGSGGHFRVEAKFVRADGSGEGWLLWIGRVFFHQGRPQRAVAVVLDITDRKQAELRQRVLLDELNHRVKNTLATVQAIAGQTLRRTSDPEAFVRSFEARLLSLSKTHNLLTHSGWRGASLRAVIEAELEPYGRGDGGRARLSGPAVELSARHAVAAGMVVHELTTNAAKYGALSRPEGRVSVTWTVAHGREAPDTLTLQWLESDGPPVTVPSREGFGSRLIRRTVEGELAGRMTLDYAPTGLRATLTLPLAEPRDDAAPAPPNGEAGARSA